MRPLDPAQKERQRAEKVADQFETVFVRTLVSSLRQTGSVSAEGGMFGSGPGADTYADWFDENLAQKVAATGHIGIKEQLLRDFERNGEIPRMAADVDRAQDHARAAAKQLTSLRAALNTGKRGLDVLP